MRYIYRGVWNGSLISEVCNVEANAPDYTAEFRLELYFRENKIIGLDCMSNNIIIIN